MTVETEPVHHAAGTEGKRVTSFVDDAHECIGARDSGQFVLGTVASVDQVCQIPLQSDGTELGNTQPHYSEHNQLLKKAVNCLHANRSARNVVSQVNV